MSDLLEVKKLKKIYYKKNSKRKNSKRKSGKQDNCKHNCEEAAAVNNVSFSLKQGEILGIVGESGCGKSTIANLITGFEKADGGSILFHDRSILHLKRKDQKEIYRSIQMVFQNPLESFDPRRTLGDSIREGMDNRGMFFSKKEREEKTKELLEMCELSFEYGDRYPHEVSGGQCQRASIARALAVSPELLICDEVTSALDVTVQRQIILLLLQLKEECKMSYLFISHDLALVQQICDRMLVMHQGKIVEEGIPDEVIWRPQSEYTKKLIEAVL